MNKDARLTILIVDDEVANLTVSIGGAATIPSRVSSFSELVCKAYAMLYEAKKQGRNRVSWTPVL